MATIMQYWFRLYDALLGRWLLILDYDRTIFDTDRYFADINAWVDATWPSLVEPMREAETAGEFDVFGFLADRTNQTQSALMNAFKAWLTANRPGYNYLQPDAHTLIAWAKRSPRITIVIVTTGAEAHQRFKLGLVPEVQGIRFRIISGVKGQHIQDEHFNQNGFGRELCGRPMKRFILIDDKVSSLSPVQLSTRNTLLIFIRRSDSKPSANDLTNSIHVVEDLQEAPALIKAAMRRR